MSASPSPDLPRERLQRLACVAEMQAMDRHAIETLGLPGRLLMENAARAVADRVSALLAEWGAPGPVVVCCGSGNNGGDGYAVARLLADRGVLVSVVRLAEPEAGDALENARAWARLGATLAWPGEREPATILLEEAALIVDALFGTGLTRPLEGDAATLVDAINAAAAAAQPAVVAVDIPSGVHGDTGQVLGHAVRCTDTVAIQLGKPGCYQQPGAAHAGAVAVAPISIPEHWPGAAPATWRTTDAFAAALLPRRTAAGHKGTFGHLLTLCGSAGMGGAALLASLAGLKLGAGLVTAGVPLVLRDRFLAAAPELMTLAAESGAATHFDAEHAPFFLAQAAERDACVLGCGLGRAADTGAFTRQIVAECPLPLLIDADALYHLRPEHLQARGAKGNRPTVITPHPGELGRLAGLSAEQVNADRMAVARRLAQDWGVVLVLKGPATVVAAPDGEAFLNATGDAGLATGGTGDVLSGMIGGLLTQGLAPLPAALLGVHLHGLARDCQRDTVAAAAFTAADLIPGINLALLKLGAN